MMHNEDCECLNLGPIEYSTFELPGYDMTNNRYGEVSIKTCTKCDRKWLRYYVEYESFTKSGRWFEGLVTEKVAQSVTAETAATILETLPWHIYGGSYFGTSGKKGKGPLSIDLFSTSHFILKNTIGNTFIFNERKSIVFCLRLAQLYGWKPRGSNRQKIYDLFKKKWSGKHKTKNKLIFTNDNAKSIAKMLSRAQKDPNFPSKADFVDQEIQKEIEKSLGFKLDYRIFSKVDLEFLQNFIIFCNQGEFFVE